MRWTIRQVQGKPLHIVFEVDGTADLALAEMLLADAGPSGAWPQEMGLDYDDRVLTFESHEARRAFALGLAWGLRATSG